MSDDKKGSGLGQIFGAVALAVLTAGSSPWWVNRFFPSDNSLPLPPKISEAVLVPQRSPEGCGEELASKLGRYEGTSVITNSLAVPKRSGKIVIDISRETDTSCRLIARVEEFDPLAGKGTLNGQFDSSAGQKVDLIGSLSHQTEPKVWEVEMNIQFVDKDSIEGQATWKPKSGIEDTKTYYEELTATKSF